MSSTSGGSGQKPVTSNPKIKAVTMNLINNAAQQGVFISLDSNVLI